MGTDEEVRDGLVCIELVVDGAAVEAERLALRMQREQRMSGSEAQLVFEELVDAPPPPPLKGGKR